jgi:hypothetical protein
MARSSSCKTSSHIELQLHRLIAERLLAEQIEFIMRPDKRVVEEAINTTKREFAAKYA